MAVTAPRSYAFEGFPINLCHLGGETGGCLLGQPVTEPLNWKDFLPCSSFISGEDLAKECQQAAIKADMANEQFKKIHFSHKVLIDRSTGRAYEHDPADKNSCSAGRWVLRGKFFFFATVGLPIMALATLVNIVFRVLLICTFYHFWCKSVKGVDYKFCARLGGLGKDLSRIIFAPLLLASIYLSAIYGLLTPLNGRKLFASFERLAYGSSMLAPCMQPKNPNNQTYLLSTFKKDLERAKKVTETADQKKEISKEAV